MKTLPPEFYTSFMFLATAALAATYHMPDVAFACVLCTITSVANHGTSSESMAKETLHALDMFVVRVIAAMYVMDCLLTFPNTFYGSATLATTLATLATYMSHLSQSMHFVVHILANLGIATYILGRSQCM